MRRGEFLSNADGCAASGARAARPRVHRTSPPSVASGRETPELAGKDTCGSGTQRLRALVRLRPRLARTAFHQLPVVAAEVTRRNARRVGAVRVLTSAAIPFPGPTARLALPDFNHLPEGFLSTR